MRWRCLPTSSASKLATLFVLAVTLSACAPFGLACTEMDSPTGIGVTVESPAAAGLERLELRICPGQTPTEGCQDSTVQLDPGSDSVDQGCDGNDPDAVCSATAVPNGSLVGFVEVSWLKTGPVVVAATTTRNAQQRDFPAVRVPAEAVYPNGRSCGSTGNQAHVTLRSDGLH